MDEQIEGYVYEDGTVSSLDDYLFLNQMRAEFCGLAEVPFFPNCFTIYYDFASRNGFTPKGFQGIYKDESGKIKTSHIPKGLVALAIVHF